MKSEVLKDFPWTSLTCAGLVIFFAVFVGVLIWVSRKERSSEFAKAQNLPLHEEVT